jgi:site-specific DNA-methyltransferase (adenine-specific)
LNIDGCRVSTDWNEPDRPASWAQSAHSAKPEAEKIAAPPGVGMTLHPEGRWPTNAVFSHSEGCRRIGASDIPLCAPDCPVRLLEEQSGVLKSGLLDGSKHKRTTPKGWSGPFADDGGGPAARGVFGGDTGTAARFFPCFEVEGDPFLYTSKASTAEREAGCENIPPAESGRHNDHSTVKNLKFMRWLVKLVTPPGGVCLDIFTGSGTTGAACVLEGFHFMGFEMDARFVEIARARIAYWEEKRR